MFAELQRLTRTFGLLWRRLGSARVYVAGAAVVVVIFAAIGIWHLISFPKPQTRTATAQVSPGAKQSLIPTAPTPAATPAESERRVEITRIEQTEKSGPHGETFVVATIGLASRGNLEKNDVEIHVYFYDLTADNEIRPTDAQVTYEWLTPVRDWSDPTPKYLAATYFKPPARHRSFENLRYGGFVVRVFSSGKLQDEISKPETLIASLRSNAAPPSRRSPALRDEGGSPPATSPSSPAVTSPPSTILNSPSSSSDSLPYGKPIPGKPGFLYSPYDEKFIIDVRGFPPGTFVNDPNTNKPFRVP